MKTLWKKYLLIENQDKLHHLLEYMWGLEFSQFDENHERNAIYVRKSMHALLAEGWTLIPTEETMAAMADMQYYNEICPIPERKNLFKEFPAAEYEYIFLPITIQEEITISGKHYSPPYTDFPRVKCSANPFFIAFHCEAQILLSDHPVCPMEYQLFSYEMSSAWKSVYPASFRQTAAASELCHNIDASHRTKARTRTALGKDTLVAKWLQSSADPQLHECVMAPLASPKVKRRVSDFKAAWQSDSTRGKRWKKRLFP
ncbi:hypothetical protein C8J56DRAFT_932648 [Mycena floridula]|nr:hypothetical protein C8J56DRAFT_932648 [Mycena floridula]